MTFVHESDRREREMTRQEPVLARPDPTFGETVSASFRYYVDEETSLSGVLNTGAFRERNRQVRQLAETGQINIEDYTSRTGRINYDRLSREYDFIESDETISEKRRELLRKRREYSQDVMERGSGLAQFVGGLGAFALDPINLATLPISSAGVAARSLSWVGKGLLVAKREAAINAATELAIQPLVYRHKSNIESPYSWQDAVTNITLAATGGAALGFVSGGISGYFKSVSEKASPFLKDEESKMALRSLEDTANFLDETRPDDAARIIDEEYGKFLSGEYADIDALKAGALSRLGKELDQANSSRMPMIRMIAEEGGLNEKAWKDAGFTADDIAKARELRKGLPKNKPLLRRKAGLTPGDFMQRLIDVGYIADGEITPKRAVEIARNAVNNPELEANAPASAKAADVETMISRVANQEGEALEQTFKQTQANVIEADAERLRERERIREQFDDPDIAPERFETPEPERVTPQTVNERQRYVLDRVGLAEEYDQAMEAYARSEGKQIFDPETGRLVEADSVLKELDEQVEGLNEILRCTVNA